MKNNSKFFGRIIVPAVAGLFILFIVVFFAFIFTASRPVVPQKDRDSYTTQRIEIKSGMSVKQTAAILRENNLIKDDNMFYYCARFSFLQKLLFPGSEKAVFVLKSGIYYIHPSMSFPEIFEILSSGKQEYVTVSIPEGYTVSKIGRILEDKGVCSRADFIEACHNPKYLARNNILGDTAEGFLFPDTYFLIPDSDPMDVAQVMTDNFYEKLRSIDNSSALGIYDLNQTVRLASIVEREYKVPEEAPLIASVFKNRLKRGIGLYSCATVEYIITEIQGKPHPKRITYDDLKIDNPYNTYKWAGLPPSPISNPGLTALSACINTPKTSYYYFQVKDVQRGTHAFTSTFDEHIGNHNLVTINKD